MSDARDRNENGQRPKRPRRGRSSDRPSPVTAGGALGGCFLVLAFFAPIYEFGPSPADDEVAASVVEDLERTLAEAREALAEAPPEYVGLTERVEPATRHAADFLETPSPKNMTWLAADVHGLVEVALIADPSQAEEIRLVRTILATLIFVLLSVPVMGTYHLVRGVATRCRKHGSVGLALSFFAGVAYLSIGAGTILVVPEAARGHVGLAAWLLALGGLLLIVTGIAGVSRETWWKAYLLELFGFIAIMYAAVTLASERL